MAKISNFVIVISNIGRITAVVFFGGLTLGRAQQPTTNGALKVAQPATAQSATNSTLSATAPNIAPVDAGAAQGPEKPSPEAIANAQLEHDVMQYCGQKQYGLALDRLNAALTVQTKNLIALNLRGYVYSKMEKWDLAAKDFEAMILIDDKATTSKFNLVELKFMQKDYAGARTGFAALVSDPDLGDLANYKVFLCDLLGGQTQKAKQELDTFNVAGMNPSYYFANAAWELIQNKNTDAAIPWLTSAGRIYYPAKVKNYSSSLFDLGYLPLRPRTASAPATTGAPGTTMLDSGTAPSAK